MKCDHIENESGCHGCDPELTVDYEIPALMSWAPLVQSKKKNKDKKPPRCLKCGVGMVKRQNGKTKSWFWGCRQFPKCRFTMNLDRKTDKFKANQELLNIHGPSVSKELGEETMFETKKWYILRKPSGEAGVNTRSGRVLWTAEMDKYNGKIDKVKSIYANGLVAWFEKCCSYAFHLNWAEGPFETKEDALRSQIKIVATREPDIEKEIVEFENGLIEFYDKAVVEKIDADHVHLRDPDTGVISVINKSALEKSEAQRKYDEWLADRPTVGSDEWKKKHANAGDTMLVEEDGGISMMVYDGKEWRTVSEPKSQCDFDRELGFSCVRPTNHSGPCTPHTDAIPTTQAVALDAPSTEDFEKLKTMVMERFDELEKQERDAEKLEKRKAYGEKVDASKKYKRDIDKLFRDYHDRNKRREELNQRIAEELGKGKPPKRSWKRFALLSGSLTAIVSSAYILYPYVNGLIQASF